MSTLADLHLYISLPHRQDRRERLAENWDYFGLSGEKVCISGQRPEKDEIKWTEVCEMEAYGRKEYWAKESDYVIGVAGTRKSHEHAMMAAVIHQERPGGESIKTVLIAEDDCRFIKVGDVDSVKNVADALASLPDSWDCLYLGYNTRAKPTPLNPLVDKLNGVRLTTAIIWNVSRIYKNFTLLRDECCSEVDVFWEKCMRIGTINAYGLRNQVCIQEDGFSDAIGARIKQPNS